MYHRPQPNLGSNFETLADLAEAAEKYQVYAAMPWCNMLMEWVKAQQL
jgi:hypothetical protein